jgi:hypothetical protein
MQQGGAMAGSAVHSTREFLGVALRGRPGWLPPRGHGNGLDAMAWAPIAQVPDDWVEPVLHALLDRGVAAWVAPVESVRDSLRMRRSARRQAHTWQLWVDTLMHARATDALVVILGDLDRRTRDRDHRAS